MNNRQKSSGQSLVEFMLILPVVLLLLAGFLDLGRVIFYYSSMTNMVREGARFGTVDPKSETNQFVNIAARVNEKSFGLPDVVLTPSCSSFFRTYECTFAGPGIQVTISRIKNVGNNFYENVKVAAVYTYIPITPGIKYIFGSVTGINLAAQSTMRISSASR